MTQPNQNKPIFPAPAPPPSGGMLCAGCLHINNQEVEARTLVDGTLLCVNHARSMMYTSRIGHQIDREQRKPKRAPAS